MKNTLVWMMLAGCCVCLTACGNPEQKFHVTVRDDAGKPLSGIACQAGFYRQSESGTGLRSYPVSGTTDAKGKVTLSGDTVYFNSAVRARAEGYYDSLMDRIWITGKNGNRWEPWPVAVELVLKKIQDPHPMYVARFDNQRWKAFPNRELGPYGFDLMACDWVAPHGSGRVADWILEGRRADPGDQGVMPAGTVTLTFSNPGDGILLDGDGGGSLLVGPTVAPEDGYQDRWVFENRPAKRSSEMLDMVWTSDESYVFRVRTKLDENGKVSATLYGKLDGRIIGWLPQNIPSVLVTYYLNGSQNDRRLEWDRKTNLVKDLTSEYWPRRP